MTRRMVALLGSWLGAAWLLLAVGVAPVAASSPDFEPSIAKLGPGQAVLIGTTGEPVPGGRAFHVERGSTRPAPRRSRSRSRKASRSATAVPGLPGLAHARRAVPGGARPPQRRLRDAPGRRGQRPRPAVHRRGRAPVRTRDGADRRCGAPPPDAGTPWLPILLGVAAAVAVAVWAMRRRRRESVDASEALERAAMQAEKDRIRTEAISRRPLRHPRVGIGHRPAHAISALSTLVEVVVAIALQAGQRTLAAADVGMDNRAMRTLTASHRAVVAMPSASCCHSRSSRVRRR